MSSDCPPKSGAATVRVAVKLGTVGLAGFQKVAQSSLPFPAAAGVSAAASTSFLGAAVTLSGFALPRAGRATFFARSGARRSLLLRAGEAVNTGAGASP